MVELRRHVAVVGGGPAGLMAAEVLAGCGVAVTVYEQHRTVGRKLLLAGRSGLNLTHGEPLEAFLARYPDLPPQIEAAIRSFPPDAVRAWASSLGQTTFVGTSGRVFPDAMRATPLLRAWLDRLAVAGVRIVTQARLVGWPISSPTPPVPRRVILLMGPDGLEVDGVETDGVEVDAVLLALGGASWPRTGSDGRWVDSAVAAGVDVRPLQASNSGWIVPWSGGFVERFAGQPLKNVTLTVGGHSARGDVVVTATGLEGGPVYALGGRVRGELDGSGSATVTVDLRPDVDEARLVQLLARRRPSDSVSTVLARGAGLAPVALGLLRESTGGPLPADREQLAALAKAVLLRIAALAPIDRAISSAGGIAAESLDGFMIRSQPGVFVAGEMLDWDAPTGGYLLQACLATGVAAAHQVVDYVTT